MIKFLAAATLLAMPVAVSAAPMMSASTYVMKAGASDLFERDSSKLVLGSTTNPKLKHFATMMVTDHTKSTDMVKAAAMKANMKVAPPMLDAEQTRNMAALRAAKGTQRDTLYIQQQKMGHQQALMLQQDYATSGSVPSLKMAAEKIVPVVKMHIADLSAM